MMLTKTASLTRQTIRFTVLLFTCALCFTAFISAAHSKPTAKPAFNAAAKGTKPSYTQPKSVLRPPISRPRSIRTTPTARKMHTQKTAAKIAPRGKTSATAARNLRKGVSTPSKSRPAKPSAALSKSRAARSTGSLRKPAGRKNATGITKSARLGLVSRSTLRKSPVMQKAKTQWGRIAGAPLATRNKATRLTNPGKTSSRAYSGATRGAHAAPIKVKNNQQAKQSLALARGSKATSGLENRGVRPKPGTRVRPAGVPANWRIKNTLSKGGTMYYNPKNKAENVRIMQGRADSKFPNSRNPYARQQHKGGMYYKKDGSLSTVRKGAEASAHIPLKDFILRQ